MQEVTKVQKYYSGTGCQGTTEAPSRHSTAPCSSPDPAQHRSCLTPDSAASYVHGFCMFLYLCIFIPSTQFLKLCVAVCEGRSLPAGDSNSGKGSRTLRRSWKREDCSLAAGFHSPGDRPSLKGTVSEPGRFRANFRLLIAGKSPEKKENGKKEKQTSKSKTSQTTLQPAPCGKAGPAEDTNSATAPADLRPRGGGWAGKAHSCPGQTEAHCLQ